QFRRIPSRHNPNPLQLASGEGDSTLFTFSPCQSERPFGGEVRLELRRAANPTVPFRCLVLPRQPRTLTFKRVTAGRLEGSRCPSSGAPLGPGAAPGPPDPRSRLRSRGTRLPRALALALVTKENFRFGFPACKQLSDFLQTLESQQPAFQSKFGEAAYLGADF
ncbi:unnamed protein product, partial [Gulo gulo]